MKFFVTGGAGFIGSHLCERLVADGHRVHALDDLSTGERANLAALEDNDSFSFERGSVTEDKIVRQSVEESDLTIHLAAAVGVKLIVEKPVHTIETNVGGTETVLRAAARYKRPVLIASTSEVYGKSAKLPFAEGDDLVLGPTTHSRWAYACSKALDEWLALAYAREQELSVIVARFFNTVGPRQTGRYGMVLPSFARQAVRGEPITVYGTGDQSRCFGHVKDAVESIVRLVDAAEARGQVFNVGSNEEVSILGLAELVREIAGSSSPIVRIPYDEAYPEGFEDMMRRVPAVEKLEAAIGFRPRTPLRTIVEDVVEEQKRKLEEAKA